MIAPVKRPKREDHQGDYTGEWREFDGDKEGAEDHHGALEQVNQRPLWLVVLIVHPKSPRISKPLHQIFQSRTPRLTRMRRIRIKPIRITIPRRLVRAQLTDEPTDQRRRRGRKHESECPPERADRHVRKGRLMLSSSSQLDGLESIDEAREEEEDRNPGMPLGHEPQNGQLEERYGTVVRAAGCYQPSREAEHHVRADDVDGGDASQTLSRTQMSVTTTFVPDWRLGRLVEQGRSEYSRQPSCCPAWQVSERHCRGKVVSRSVWRLRSAETLLLTLLAGGEIMSRCCKTCRRNCDGIMCFLHPLRIRLEPSETTGLR